ncbi:hypothetical protein CEN39_23900 [Fischerella thermalis CCMEE 5201]|jgi:hypothetical protein|nr:hypothetical protein CEN39_23900 [Fischerella thermalis CCMEE 5201]
MFNPVVIKDIHSNIARDFGKNPRQYEDKWGEKKSKAKNQKIFDFVLFTFPIALLAKTPMGFKPITHNS